MKRGILTGWLCIVLSMAACGDGPEAESPASRPAGAVGTGVVGTPPGAEPFPEALRRSMREALAAMGADYVPRTHHVRDDGSPMYTNRLILESSPYLLQHAHNPVNWNPWGDEAFETARRLQRPLLLSIGYSTCHWCHVMERESFEDEEIARYLNENYVAIKVDREERPDLDAIYMSAVQMIAGRGGWPMTTWLTPEREPFYGGTYYPARDGDRGARVGFLTLLRKLRESYDESSEDVARRAASIAASIRQRIETSGPLAADLPGRQVLDRAASFYEERFDAVHGGTRQAPKFPSNFPVRLFLRHHRATGEPRYLKMAALTLEKMAHGGIHDQVGGGFHRYSVDGVWLVPHFEKMLYDNALLAVAYLEGYQATGREAFADVARGILDYVGREMTSPDGGFYSATDADSPNPEGHVEEGSFFTWTIGEIEAAVGKERTPLVVARYGPTLGGNFEGRNILRVSMPLQAVAKQFALSVDDAESVLGKVRAQLYDARSRRPAPLRDEKILTSWNGLMISAFAIGGLVLGDETYVDRAERAARFVLANSRREGRLLRSFKDGRARHNAYLDDYALLIAGLLDLYEASSDLRWLREALALQKVLDARYRDTARGGYFTTSDDHEALLVREKPSYDGAEPSGNSVALMNLLRLHEFTTDDRYRASADALLRGFGSKLNGAPAALSDMLLAVDFRTGTPREIVIVTPRSRDDAEPFLAQLRRTFLPNRILVVVSAGDNLEAQSELVPLLRRKRPLKGQATAYVCERGVCELPTTDAEIFARQILGQPVSPPQAGSAGRVRSPRQASHALDR